MAAKRNGRRVGNTAPAHQGNNPTKKPSEVNILDALADVEAKFPPPWKVTHCGRYIQIMDCGESAIISIERFFKRGHPNFMLALAALINLRHDASISKSSMTQQETRCLMFIRSSIATTGRSPSRIEIADHLGTKSKSSIERHIERLMAKGFIEKRNAGGHRGYVLTQVGAMVSP